MIKTACQARGKEPRAKFQGAIPRWGAIPGRRALLDRGPEAAAMSAGVGALGSAFVGAGWLLPCYATAQRLAGGRGVLEISSRELSSGPSPG